MTPLNCPRCGSTLRPDEGHTLCMRCMLTGGAASAPTDRPFAAPSLAELRPHFPELELLELAGQGGMGAVYRARQPRLDRYVALKVLRPDAASDPAFRERFLREARVLARLAHPGVVGVHDFGVTGELYWLLMEYVDGASLREVIEAGSLPARDALALIPALCEALQFAHDQGVVHRDIKPENILLDASGRVRIADFGLASWAQSAGGSGRLTGTHQVLGTPRYMAPEQLEGGRAVDQRTDLYALGIVLYELLTGELPLGRFEPPSKRSPAVDPRFDPVVMKSLERDPCERYQRASELRDALAGIERAPEPEREVDAADETTEGELWTVLCVGALFLAAAGVAFLDSPWSLLALYLPGSLVGAVMAARPIPRDDAAFAGCILVAALGAIAYGMTRGQGGALLIGLLALLAGIGAGHAEIRSAKSNEA